MLFWLMRLSPASMTALMRCRLSSMVVVKSLCFLMAASTVSAVVGSSTCANADSWGKERKTDRVKYCTQKASKTSPDQLHWKQIHNQGKWQAVGGTAIINTLKQYQCSHILLWRFHKCYLNSFSCKQIINNGNNKTILISLKSIIVKVANERHVLLQTRSRSMTVWVLILYTQATESDSVLLANQKRHSF